MRIVETYSNTPVEFYPGVVYPSSCLLEDEGGTRLLLVEDLTRVLFNIWNSAHMAGASFLVQHHPGLSWLVVATEEFGLNRTEDRLHATYSVPTSIIQVVDQSPFPSHQDILLAATQQEQAPSKGRFVHLHTHSEFSPLDGLSKVTEIIEAAQADGQEAVALTDHGTCAGHPSLVRECKKAGMKAVLGIEGYFIFGDRRERLAKKPTVSDFETKIAFDAAITQHEIDKARIKDYNHLVLWAENQEGLKNLWALSTEAYRDGFYSHPRFDWDSLERHSSGLLVSTACLRGPLSRAIIADDEEQTRSILGRMMAIFPDRLYLELHANQMEDQKKINQVLVNLGQEYGLPTVAVVDSHYPSNDHFDAHQVWIACQTGKEVGDETDLFAHDLELFMQTEDQVRSRLAYLGPQAVDEAVGNTALIAERCNATVKSVSTTPTFTRPIAIPGYEQMSPEEVEEAQHARDAERLHEICMANWHLVASNGAAPGVNEARYERERGMVVAKRFCGYFLMVAEYVADAKEGRVYSEALHRFKKMLVGPGRGSGGGSIVAFLCKITALDPVLCDLLFERFMTEGRTELPDFDVDFQETEKQSVINHTRKRWGSDYVMQVGTHTRMRNKGTVKDITRAMQGMLPEGAMGDAVTVNKVIDRAEESTAGLGMSWEDLWVQHVEDLGPYRQKYPVLYEMCDVLTGRIKTYSKHAAGVVISTQEPLTDTLPLRAGSDDEGAIMISQFDMNDLTEQGLVKFDLLTLRTLDTIQMAMDLVLEQTGYDIDIYSWDEEYKDPYVWDEISKSTLGIFQIETNTGTRYTKRMMPTSLAELADVITIVRPGPVRSGLTETYLRRRNGSEPVSFPDPRMADLLAKTYGCMLYQEDIMNACIVLAGYSSDEADKVRKVLGKKQVDKVEEAGRKFIPACVERGMEQQAVEMLWAQMAEFAKYSFNRAHAYAYAMLGYWCAWFKFHYPLQFITAALSTVDADRIKEFIKEARRMGYQILPPDINESGIGFKAIPQTMTGRYGLDRLAGIGVPTTQEIVANQPYTSYDDFIERTVTPKGSKVNMGHVATLASIGAFDSLGVNRRGLVNIIQGDKEGITSRCQHKVDGYRGPQYLPLVVTEKDKPGEVLPCTFDWASEPVKCGRDKVHPKTGEIISGKPLKNQPTLPKKCSKACRNYTAPERPSPDDWEPYHPHEIEAIEVSMLGVYLTSTPFDRLPDDLRTDVQRATEELVGEGGEGVYDIVGIVTAVRQTEDKRGRKMCFLTVGTEFFDISVTVFNKERDIYSAEWSASHLPLFCFLSVGKTERGIHLNTLLTL